METKDFELGPKQKEWLQALRDNPEQQYKGSLGRENYDKTLQMCCLMKYASLTYVKGVDWEISKCNVIKFTDESTVLPEKVYKTLKLNSPYGHSNNKESSLAHLNDQKMNWIELADHIEANYKQYFTESY